MKIRRLLCAALLLGAFRLAEAQNQVLILDGSGDYVKLPAFPSADLTASTVECWVNWDLLHSFSQPFAFGSATTWQALGVNNFERTGTLQFFIYTRRENLYLIRVPDFLSKGQWYHLAAVAGPGGMKLYVNGALLGENPYEGSFAAIGGDADNYLGKSNWKENEDFAGQLDEVRLWRVARTQEEIRAAMHQRLTGREEGLVALWNFDQGDVRDSTPNGYHGQFRGDAHCALVSLPSPGELPLPAVLYGKVANAAGQLLSGAEVRLEQRGIPLVKTGTDSQGRYQLAVAPAAGDYDLIASRGELRGGQWNLRLEPGKRSSADLILSEAVSMGGTLLTLDGVTPNTGVLVEARWAGPGVLPAAYALSDEQGYYRFANLRPGPYRLHCQVPTEGDNRERADTLVEVKGGQQQRVDLRFPPFKKGAWRTLTYLEGLASNQVRAVLRDRDGLLWLATLGGVSRYDGKRFENFTTEDGLAHNRVNAIYQDRDGVLWFGTGGGLSRYEGRHFQNFTTRDGLAHDDVTTIYRDREEGLWVGTYGGGVSRYDGKRFANLTAEDGLAHDVVLGIHQDAEGRLWFATLGGVSVYDGRVFRNYGEGDGLGNSVIHSLLPEPQGRLWFGTEDGVSLYDGHRFARFAPLEVLRSSARDAIYHAFAEIYRAADGVLWLSNARGLVHYAGQVISVFTPQDGLASKIINALHPDGEGGLWLATDNGLSHYDHTFSTLNAQDGLPDPFIYAMDADREGKVWLATSGGLSRYDGHTFRNFTTRDGLIHDEVQVVFLDPEGTVWCGMPSGVSSYDGHRFRNFTTQDGLVDPWARIIFRDADGILWVGTQQGLSRYDGRSFHTFTSRDGLAGTTINALCADGRGGMWIGTDKGLSHYDGHTFITREDVASSTIHTLHVDTDGVMWIGTDGGLWRYDGDTVRTFTTRDGLASNQVTSLLRDRQGLLWCGTYDGGVCAYDGQFWTTLDTRDGLAGNRVTGIRQLPDNTLLFATDRGLTQYRRSFVPPRVRITGVQTDSLYADLRALPSLTSGYRLTLHYSAVDFKTAPQKRQYRYRIEGADWGPLTHAEAFEWTPQEAGAYTFEVQAMDRDLNLSEVARLALAVMPPWYRDPRIALPLGGGGLALLVVSILSSTRYYAQRRESARLREQMLDQERQARAALEAQNGQLEEARQAAEAANQAKSIFLANMSHEIRTPMNAILGYAQILEDDPRLTPDQQRAIQTIEASGSHLLSLINSVLDISKIEAGRQEFIPVGFDLTELVTNLASMFRLGCQQQRLGWNLEAPEGPCWVYGDANKLRQVLINLLGNALKFTDEGEVGLVVRAQAEARYYFAVYDTGPGIPLERQGEIFEPFEQGEEGREKGGTGLGLAIARRHVELMGGTLELDSAPGQGARFFFMVPLSPALPPDHPAGAGRVLHLKAGFAVEALIVDDVAQNRAVLSQLLAAIGVEVRQAASGAEALEMARQQLPDLVLSDVRMPVMDGMELMRRLWAEHGRGKLRIAAISASVLAHQRREYLEAGFEAFLDKPFRKEALYDCLRQLLGVEYEYTAAAPAAPAPSSWQEAQVPKELLARLRAAAQIYSVTELELGLDEVEQLGPAGGQLAEHLRNLSRQYDMNAILMVLEGLPA